MRWKQRPQRQRRVKRRFLILPKCVNGEWRWLEVATYEQRLESSWSESYWIDTKWIDDEERA